MSAGQADPAQKSLVALVYNAVTRDGAVDAFLRQGARELGTAFGKAFPDSIQVDEPGQAFHPLYSDIAADKRERASQETGPALPSPAAITRDGQASGSVYGDPRQEKPDLPSPGQIAALRPEPMPQQVHGHDHAQDHGRDM